MKKSSPPQNAKARAGAGTLDKGLTVLETVEASAHPVGVQEIAGATGIQRLAVYRLLCTLEERGVARDDAKRYRAMRRRRKLLIGYAGPLTGNTFREDAAASLQQAAHAEGVDLMLLDNGVEDQEAGNAQRRDGGGARGRCGVLPTSGIAEDMMAADYRRRGGRSSRWTGPSPGGRISAPTTIKRESWPGGAGAVCARALEGAFNRVVLVEGPNTSTNVQA
ncbi:MAG: helix-turn-helix domain-containing protein [Bryobacterales bacterium]|nr:helix-turn-helix domain-containing protein [Bryobacterales bacterium]